MGETDGGTDRVSPVPRGRACPRCPGSGSCSLLPDAGGLNTEGRDVVDEAEDGLYTKVSWFLSSRQLQVQDYRAGGRGPTLLSSFWY